VGTHKKARRAVFEDVTPTVIVGRWLGYFLLYLAPCVVAVGLLGLIVGSLIGSARLGVQVDVPRGTPGEKPAGSPALWLQD